MVGEGRDSVQQIPSDCPKLPYFVAIMGNVSPIRSLGDPIGSLAIHLLLHLTCYDPGAAYDPIASLFLILTFPSGLMFSCSLFALFLYNTKYVQPY